MKKKIIKNVELNFISDVFSEKIDFKILKINVYLIFEIIF